MKTINFELSKRLNDLGLLDNIETEYVFYEHGIYGNEYKVILKKYGQVLNPGEINIYPYFVGELELKGYEKSYKTLTLEEAIEFLPTQINNYYFVFGKTNGYWCNYLKEDEGELYILNNALLKSIYNKKTFLEAIEKMIEHLLDHDLLTKFILGNN